MRNDNIIWGWEREKMNAVEKELFLMEAFFEGEDVTYWEGLLNHIETED